MNKPMLLTLIMASTAMAEDFTPQIQARLEGLERKVNELEARERDQKITEYFKLAARIEALRKELQEQQP